MIAIAVIAAALAANSDDDVEPRAGTGITLRTTTTTTTPTTVATATAAETTTTVPAPTTSTPLPTAPPAGRCVSVPPGDPRPTTNEWYRYWHTQPQPNDGISLTLCIDDVTTRVGQVVTLRVVADDPDASIGTGPCDVIVEWDGQGNLCHDTVSPTDPEPQPTPAEQPGHVDLTFKHTYDTPGERIVYVDVWSGPDDGHKPHPYHSTAAGEIKLVVR